MVLIVYLLMVLMVYLLMVLRQRDSKWIWGESTTAGECKWSLSRSSATDQDIFPVLHH